MAVSWFWPKWLTARFHRVRGILAPESTDPTFPQRDGGRTLGIPCGDAPELILPSEKIISRGRFDTTLFPGASSFVQIYHRTR